MTNAALAALHKREGSSILIQSPAVGYWVVEISPESLLSEGASIGRLKIMNRLFRLVLPSGVQGRVALMSGEDRIVPVEYGQELFRLETADLSLHPSHEELEPSEDVSISLDNKHLVRAFTTGIFYRQSSPDVPPYVEEGQTVEKGKVLGLIEVMKSFNQIVFTGDESFDRGRLVAIYPQDSQEVKSGQPLFLIEKA